MNLIADSIRAALIAGLQSSAQRESLLGLVDDQYLGGWIAFAGMDIDALEPFQTSRCLDKIKQIAGGSTLEGVGARAWLRNRGFDA